VTLPDSTTGPERARQANGPLRSTRSNRPSPEAATPDGRPTAGSSTSATSGVRCRFPRPHPLERPLARRSYWLARLATTCASPVAGGMQALSMRADARLFLAYQQCPLTLRDFAGTAVGCHRHRPLKTGPAAEFPIPFGRAHRYPEMQENGGEPTGLAPGRCAENLLAPP
jgi:hypothetical protein